VTAYPTPVLGRLHRQRLATLGSLREAEESLGRVPSTLPGCGYGRPVNVFASLSTRCPTRFGPAFVGWAFYYRGRGLVDLRRAKRQQGVGRPPRFTRRERTRASGISPRHSDASLPELSGFSGPPRSASGPLRLSCVQKGTPNGLWALDQHRLEDVFWPRLLRTSGVSAAGSDSPARSFFVSTNACTAFYF